MIVKYLPKCIILIVIEKRTIEYLEKRCFSSLLKWVAVGEDSMM